MMGLYGEAVALALKVRLNEYAEEYAQQHGNEDDKKKLWL